MAWVHIDLCGCDDTTRMTVDVTDEELRFLKQLEVRSQEQSRYSCQPIMQLHQAENPSQHSED